MQLHLLIHTYNLFIIYLLIYLVLSITNLGLKYNIFVITNFQNGAVSKALTDYFSCMKAEEKGKTEGLEPARRLISDYGSWNITDPKWEDSNWQFMPRLVEMHRIITLFKALFTVTVKADLRNSSNNLIWVRHKKVTQAPQVVFSRQCKIGIR